MNHAHAGHGAHMVQDVLRRFSGSAILTVPIVLYSPLGTSLFGRELAPPFGLSRGLLGFLLTSIVVRWGGWPFVSAAARSLRQGELTMMTLIATGILVSYAYSAAVTFGLPGEPFYDAAAMLTAFSLLGHWLEMRGGSAPGRPARRWLDLAPPPRGRAWVGTPRRRVRAVGCGGGDRDRLSGCARARDADRDHGRRGAGGTCGRAVPERRGPRGGGSGGHGRVRQDGDSYGGPAVGDRRHLRTGR